MNIKKTILVLVVPENQKLTITSQWTLNYSHALSIYDVH